MIYLISKIRFAVLVASAFLSKYSNTLFFLFSLMIELVSFCFVTEHSHAQQHSSCSHTGVCGSFED